MATYISIRGRLYHACEQTTTMRSVGREIHTVILLPIQRALRRRVAHLWGDPFRGSVICIPQYRRAGVPLWEALCRSAAVVYWEAYGKNRAVDLFLDANTTRQMETDTWRQEGID